MFTPEFFIDTFQNTKKSIFRRMTDDKQLHEIADRYIDTQTQFAKMLVSNFIDVTKYSLNKITECFLTQKKSEVSAPYKIDPVTKETN